MCETEITTKVERISFLQTNKKKLFFLFSEVGKSDFYMQIYNIRGDIFREMIVY